MHQSASHFKGKDARGHLHDVKTEGSNSETHGAESPGHKGAFADALREVTFILLLLFASFLALKIQGKDLFILYSATALGLMIWKTGRSGWLGWTRLERLHRLIDQERYEIEHNRDQEREELVELYQAKGFQEPLLSQIVDHLMADSDRLLKVMIEEEMGLSLEAYEHPLKQAFGAFLGALLSSLLFLFALFVSPDFGPFIAAALTLSIGALYTAYSEGNRMIHALIWTLALATLAATTTYFLIGLL